MQFIQKYNLGNSVPNIMMLRTFVTIAVSVATCERSFLKRKLIKNYLRSNFAVEKCCHTVCRATIERQYKFWHSHWRICQQKGKKSYCVENCSFHFKNKDGPNFLHFFYYFSLYVIFAFCLTVTYNVWIFCVYLKHTMFENVKVLYYYNGAQTS